MDDEGLREKDTVMLASSQDKGDIVVSTPQISLHAMSGVFFPQTLKFKASIANLEVYVLVDGGSTHNFIQS